jgi:hypothetical protein
MGMSPSGKASDFDSDKGWFHHPLVGSNPTIPAKCAGIAQLVERRPRTAQVLGSTPGSSSKSLLVMFTFVRFSSLLYCYLCERHSRVHTVFFGRRVCRCDASWRHLCRCSSEGRVTTGWCVSGSNPVIGRIDVAQEEEQPQDGMSLVQVQSSTDIFAPKATELTPRKDEGMRWHSSVGRAPVLYSGCRGFKSCCQLHPHER